MGRERGGGVGEVLCQQLLLVGDVAHAVLRDVDLLHQLVLDGAGQLRGLDLVLKSADLLLQGAHLRRVLRHGGRDAVELRHRGVHMVAHGVEGALDGLARRIVVAGTVLERAVHGLDRAVERALHARQALLGVGHQVALAGAGRTRLGQQVARLLQHARGGADHIGERGHRVTRVAQARRARIQRAVQIRDEGRHLVAVHKVQQARGGHQPGVADGLGKGLVDLLAHGARRLVGHARGDGARLLVLVI